MGRMKEYMMELAERKLKKWKDYLPVKSYDEVKFYDAETGTPKFKVDDVMMDGKGFCYLIK